MATKTGGNDDLADVLRLDIGAKVMLLRNIDVSDGLVNGAFGKVVGIDQTNLDTPARIVYVQFDSDRIGKKQDPHNAKGIPKAAVGIKPHEDEMANKKGVVRRQFPLKLAWACTIHKTQGMTTTECVVDMKGIFSNGQAYVALSRVTSMSGLYIKNYNQNMIYRSEVTHEYLQKMDALEYEDINEHPMDNCFQIVHHNVQGLLSKLPDIKVNSSTNNANLFVLNETFLCSETSNAEVEMTGYAVLRNDRSSKRCRGGVAMYLKGYSDEEMSKMQLVTPVTSKSCEHLALSLLLSDVPFVILSVYRPPTFSKQQFVASLQYLIDFTDKYENVIFAGDFNEDLKAHTPKPIMNLFTEFGYQQLVNKATTSYGSTLDHVYVRSALSVTCKVVQTYFSDHEAVKLNIWLKHS